MTLTNEIQIQSKNSSKHIALSSSPLFITTYTATITLIATKISINVSNITTDTIILLLLLIIIIIIIIGCNEQQIYYSNCPPLCRGLRWSLLAF